MSIVSYRDALDCLILQTIHEPSNSLPKPFFSINPDAALLIFSFLSNSEVAHFSRTCQGAHELKNTENNHWERSNFSKVRIFGREQYKLHWGREITDEFDPDKINIRVLRAFLNTYYGPNPVDPSKRIKDTCLIPTVVTPTVRVDELVQDVQIIRGDDERSIQQTTDNERLSKLVIVLKNLVGFDKPWSRESINLKKRGQVQLLRDLNTQTRYGCETEPDAFTQNTVLLAHTTATREYPFGTYKITYPQSQGELFTVSTFKTALGRTREIDSTFHHLTSGLKKDISETVFYKNYIPPDDRSLIGVAVMHKF